MSAGKQRVERPFLGADASVQAAIPAIDWSGRYIALVTGNGGRLLAMVTDSKPCRRLLPGIGLATCLAEYMHCDTTTIRADEDPDTAAALIQEVKVGACAVILDDVAAGAICGGVPAVPLGRRA